MAVSVSQILIISEKSVAHTFLASAESLSETGIGNGVRARSKAESTLTKQKFSC
jgi:hypothetical protein